MKWIKHILKLLIPEAIITGMKQALRKRRFRGSGFYCPVCESSMDTFYPLGYDLPVITEKQIIGGGKRDALCPVCESSDRTRLLHLFFLHHTKLYTQSSRLLHVAPEAVLRRKFQKNKKLDYLTADLNPEHVMEPMDITQIKYPDQTFDTIIANHVLEHIPDDRKAMAELWRVLKPGGMAVLQVPISKILKQTFEDFSVTGEKEREKVFGQTDHVRIYGQDYIARLKEAGFEVKPFNWTKDPQIAPEGKRCGLNPDELIFCCYKNK